MNDHYSLGLDYGTNSVRAIIVNVADGQEIANVALAACQRQSVSGVASTTAAATGATLAAA